MSELLEIFLSMTPCLFPIFFIMLAIVIGTLSASAMRRRITEGWGSLGQRTGLTLTPNTAPNLFSGFSVPQLSGSFEGRVVKLWTYTVRHGKSSTRYTAMQMELKNPANYTLSIRRQHGLDGIGKALGMQDVQVGDAAFDNEFVIKSKPEGVAQALFGGGSMVREAVRRIPRGGIEIVGPALVYKQTNLETDTETLYSIITSLREIANAIEGKTDSESEAYAGDSAFQPEQKQDSIWSGKDAFDSKDEFGGEDQFGGKAEYGMGDVHDSHSNDPFYQKKPQPDPYGKMPNDPFGPPPTAQTNWRPILLGAFIAFDLVCFAVLAVLYFSGAFSGFFQ